MDEVLKLLQGRVFYFGTCDGGQPRVRPFGFAMVFEGRMYFTTGNHKEIYRQLQADPRFEICTMVSDSEWIRLSGKAVIDGSKAARVKAFELYPGFAGLYGTPDDPRFEVFYIADGEAKVYSYGRPVPRTIKL